MFIAQYKKGPQSFCDTSEEVLEVTKDKEWLRIYEIDTSTGKILRDIYPKKKS